MVIVYSRTWKQLLLPVILWGMILAFKSRLDVVTNGGGVWHKSNTNNNDIPYKIILGVSTGHSGSTTAQHTLEQQCLSTPRTFRTFERTHALHELDWNHSVDHNTTCHKVQSVLIPHLHKLANNNTLIDLGHFHNRGVAVLECLANNLGEDGVFVRIRRNRYDAAMSFSSHYYTPCITSKEIHSRISVCPHSEERATAGPVYLNVDDDVWDAFTPFQRFLWYADEMEERWHVLTNKVRSTNMPQFYEITWSDSDELKHGLNALCKSLGCNDTTKDNDEATVLKKEKPHVAHKAGGRNCSDMIRQDLEYRRLMNYDTSQSYRLFEAYPQHVDSPDCKDTYDELVSAIRQYSGKDEVNLDSWVLPKRTNG